MDANKAKHLNLKQPLLLWLAWFGMHIASTYLIPLISMPLRLGYRYTDVGVSFGLPEWINVHANFDGVHYMTIAREGYGLTQQAFFPLYPELLRFVSVLFLGNTLLAGWSLSVVFSLCAVIIWYVIFEEVTQNAGTASLSILALLFFPGAFFLVSVYTESLFLLLLGLYFWGLMKRKYWLVGFVGVLLGITRLAGSLTILIPLTGIALAYVGTKRINLRQLFAGVTPLIGLCAYMIYSWINSGDAFAFFHIQEKFNNGRSTSMVLLPQVIWRYLRIFVSAKVDLAYFVAVVEFVVFCTVLGLLLWGLWREITRLRAIDDLQKQSGLMLGLILFSLANLLLPTFTGTLSSIPRYALVGIAICPLVSLLPKSVRIGYLVCSFTLQTILFMLFAQGWFVS